MLKKINIYSDKDVLYITDDEKEAEKLLKEKEAVLFVCENPENAPFIQGCRFVTDTEGMKDHGYLAMVYSRYKNIPLQILETERTYVREITTDDVKALYSLYDDEALKYVEPLYEYDEEVIFTKKYIENMYGFYGYGLWLVFEKETDELIGRAGIEIRNIDGADKNELAYIIRKDYRRKGYGYEVCKAILNYAFTKLSMDEVVIVIEKR